MKKSIGIAGVVLALLLAGCGQSSSSSSANKNKVLNVTLQSNPATADPAISGDVNSSAMIAQTMEGLYRYDNNGKVVAGVAEKVVKPTNNGTVYTINLKKNAKWANGQQVTAQDFVTSFDHQVDPTSKSQVASDLKYVKNFAAVQAGKVKPSAFGIKALSKTKVQITLSKPQPWFGDILAAKAYPINTAAFKKYGNKFGTSSKTTVTNGPYALSDWNSTSDTWYYKKNTHYWGKNDVKINKIKVSVVKDPGTAQSLFKSGKLQETQITGTYVKANENNKQLVKTPNGSMRFLEFNDKHKITHNKNVRLAFNNVVNRKQLTTSVLQDGSQPAESLIPKGDLSNPKTGEDFTKEAGQLTSYNPKQATSLWNKAKKELGIKKATLTMITADTDVEKHVAQYLQQQAQKYMPGLTIDLKSVPLAQQISLGAKLDYDIDLDGWTTNWHDPLDFLQVADGSNPVNFTKWNDKTYQNMIKEINDTAKYTTQERYNLMLKADKYVTENAGLVPLYQQSKAYLVSKEVGGLNYTLITNGNYRYAYWK
ncbi:ABC-type oligopeptide transport system, periplasmic component [Secundilactobacillus odoratitofui DSM 19909 = JCM 15043]|uniref:ABC-type oligopeptide transport system, periplasmic component n=1 Tax=Secundilactobacillus odoratitofui DSM 19909 = JCM 15043 TaxID=1423776 RepID=A0A0R1M5C4_9LACO|nr:peptide ABC transporter substrate-binding protein [Secundilactobacillus odoratitofui]KRK99626.1 ABC-type oligopeptide transport system, periplasmic component [Secundilactobacillus odoratitofui DSM 19909 = JCM 15043]